MKLKKIIKKRARNSHESNNRASFEFSNKNGAIHCASYQLASQILCSKKCARRFMWFILQHMEKDSSDRKALAWRSYSFITANARFNNRITNQSLCEAIISICLESDLKESIEPIVKFRNKWFLVFYKLRWNILEP